MSDIITCPHCDTTVLPSPEGQCPACRQNVRQPKLADDVHPGRRQSTFWNEPARLTKAGWVVTLIAMLVGIAAIVELNAMLPESQHSAQASNVFPKMGGRYGRRINALETLIRNPSQITDLGVCLAVSAGGILLGLCVLMAGRSLLHQCGLTMLRPKPLTIPDSGTAANAEMGVTA